MIIVLYVSNLLIALWNLLRAWVGVYRPNGHTYFVAWWYCVDCLCNALLGGDPRETISSRAAKAQAAGEEWGCVLCAFLAGITASDHCALSLAANEGSRAVIPDGQ